MSTVRCDTCEALAINGHPSHELGCPNSRRPWVVINGYCLPDKTNDVDNSDFDLQAEINEADDGAGWDGPCC